MNLAFDEVLAAGTDAMLSTFHTTALRLSLNSEVILAARSALTPRRDDFNRQGDSTRLEKSAITHTT